MALRNQPYIPLYVNDFITDEKLIECSAEATGVYIRLMCILHKSEEYGQLVLSNKYNDKDIIKNYADMLSKQMPYSYEIIYRSLQELLQEKVLIFMGNILTQKRMYNDGLLSKERAKAGSIGGKRGKQKSSKVLSKSQANAVYEYEDVNDNSNTYYKNIELNKIFIEYLSLRKKLKAINSDLAIKLLMNKLEPFDDDTKIKMIENSIQNSWKSVFELKGQIKRDDPTWLNKEIKSKEMSVEEEKELQDSLKEFS